MEPYKELSLHLINFFLYALRHFTKLALKHIRETYREGEQLHEFITVKFSPENCVLTDTQYKAPTSLTHSVCRFTGHI